MSLLSYQSASLEALESRGDRPGFSHSDKLQRWKEPLVRAKSAILDAHQRKELGFLTCFEDDIEAMQALTREILTDAKGFTHQLILGIGGSSLGALAILATRAETNPPEGYLETHFSENMDPRSFKRLLDHLPLEKTLVIVISKSGTTIETMSKFWIVHELLVDRVGFEEAASQIVAITDPESGSLRRLVNERGFRSFGVPPEVGGRFSVLTPVGLLPLMLAGYDVEGLIAGASAAVKHITSSDIEQDITAQAAADQIELLRTHGIDEVVLMPYCDDLLPLADWFRQLWAESLGKRFDRHGQEVFTGITPLKALGVIDQHSQVQLYMEGPPNKHVMFLEVETFDQDFEIPQREGFPEALHHLQGKSMSEILRAELEGTQAALSRAGRPTSRWSMTALSSQSVGAFILCWEMITALAGELLDIDAYDQPGVELGKKIAHGLLGHPRHQALLEEITTISEQSQEGEGSQTFIVERQ